MILLPCPHCGPRDAAEFSYHGEPTRRPDPDAVSTEQWRSYLYLQRNPAGWTTELWLHRAGCGRFLEVQRHTVSNEIGANEIGADEIGADEIRADEIRATGEVAR